MDDCLANGSVIHAVNNGERLGLSGIEPLLHTHRMCVLTVELQA